jgi:osmotically-inducible protein OsmY
MTQEMATLGKDVAQAVAEQLGLSVIRNEISDRVAGKVRKPESAIRRYMEGQASIRERLKTERDSLAVYSAEDVLEYASKGDVLIRGWGGNYLLRPVSHVLSVRICAPMDKRIEWLMEHLDIDDRKFAESEIRRSDAAHAANIRRWWHTTWGDPLAHDVTLNTDRVSVDTAAQLISNATQQPEFQETAASRQKLEDLMLEARCRAALLNNALTWNVRISVEARDRVITLSGYVFDKREYQTCEQLAAAVAGVESVNNQLKAMSSYNPYG